MSTDRRKEKSSNRAAILIVTEFSLLDLFYVVDTCLKGELESSKGVYSGNEGPYRSELRHILFVS